MLEVNTLAQVKNAFDGFISRSDTAEERNENLKIMST